MVRNITTLITATVAALTASLILGTGAAAAAPAPAKHGDRDQQPCVADVEVTLAGVYAGRTLLEDRWEVQGQGQKIRPGDIPFAHLMLDPDVRPGSHLVRYPACGYDADEAGVVVFYDRHRVWYHIFRWIKAGSTYERAA